MPTIYELCGITAPTDLNGVQQKPIEGVSFAFTFDDAKAASQRKTQYFELGCNRGLYHDGWMASSPSFVPWEPNRGEWDPDKAPWELYKIDEDFSQAQRPRRAVSRRSCASCRICGGWKPRSTACCRSIGAATIRMNAEAHGTAEPDPRPHAA